MIRILSFSIALIFTPLPLRAVELQVFAAASLTNALKEIAPEFQKTTGDTLSFNFAGSNILSRQIQEGAPADVFFSADEAKMDDLEKADLLLENARLPLLSNTLVVIVGENSELKKAEELGDVRLLALADPAAVPAGVYAKEYLEKTGLWERLKNKIVATENVRGALAAVESGNADAGFVYKTDAPIGKGIKVAFEVPPAEGPKISYPVAVIKESKNPEAAKRLLEFLRTEPAVAVFKKHGFIFLP